MLSDIASLQVIACLDVRANDEGDLVVTKGDQYDVREHAEQSKVWWRIPLALRGIGMWLETTAFWEC